MEPGELMIGNYVNDGNKPVKILSIGQVACKVIDLEDDSVDAQSEYICPNKRLKPIKLTERWLIDLSSDVELIKQDIYYIIDRFRLLWVDNYEFWYVSDKESLTYITKVEFVHEWQNVFFVLNGKKLTK